MELERNKGSTDVHKIRFNQFHVVNRVTVSVVIK